MCYNTVTSPPEALQGGREGLLEAVCWDCNARRLG